MNEEIKYELEKLTTELGGELKQQIIVDSYGKTSRRVVITYPDNK